MKKSTLGILILSGLLFAACDDSDVPEPKTIECGAGGTFSGVLGDNLFSASMDDNATHQSGYCLPGEACVHVYDSSGSGMIAGSFACSNTAEGTLSCDGETTKVDDNINNCGRCGNKCGTDEKCESGVCKPSGTSCEDGTFRCASSGDASEICSEGKWTKYEECVAGCKGGACIARVCDEGSVKCSSDNMKQIVCNNNREEETACADGCSDGKCNDHICDENAKRCSGDGLGIQICNNNTWKSDSVCGENEECTAKAISCACKPGTTRCDGVCADLLTDPNNCGSCGNKVESCVSGQACAENNDYIRPYSKVSSCCDPNAKMYVYLNNALDCDENYVRYNNTYSYSLTYCMTDADVKAVPNYSKCIVSADSLDYLSDDSKCGISSASFEACTLVATTGAKKNPEVCRAGRCCFEPDLTLPVDGAGPDASTSYNETHTFNKNDCCSKIAYKKTNIGGTWYYCAYDADYYKEACSPCPSGNTCEVDEAKKSCSIRNSGTGTSITML